MKHIKKKFYFNEKPDERILKHEKAEILDLKDGVNEESLKGKKGYISYIKTEDDDYIGGFIHKIDGKNYIMPIPDPTLIYFNNAQDFLRSLEDDKKKLISKLNFQGEIPESAINELYNFYGRTSGFIIFLFTSIESFINQMVPENFVFVKELPRKTEVYNKIQIQESLDFKTKITGVLSGATSKNFFAKSTPANQLIWRLKEFRDDIIHTKDKGETMRYDVLITNSLNFPFEKCLKSVATFMNFYKKDYVIECDCGEDF